MNKNTKQFELPEILYDEPKPGHEPNPFPFIIIKKGQTQPVALFVELRTETGETGPGAGGITEKIYDGVMHKFVDLEVLNKRLPPHLNNMVRSALGLEPLDIAKKKGEKILNKVEKNMKNAISQAQEVIKESNKKGY